MDDFGSFRGTAQAFYTPKFKQIAQDPSRKREKSTVGKKDLKKACAKKWDPYNAPPSKRQT
ncbi:hypothetical protein [Pseudescherichia sp.]|uniref:hypothetical protein n=1 Tax=Pseudescherichia sp. TaxID=2055881 RepID=UPI0028A2D0C6|nr:hypothetical protein [Pseudescherichia sp.]